MKKTLLILTAILSFNLSTAQWRYIDVVDDFGDKVGTTEAYIGSGQFSNTATNGSEMIVKITVKHKAQEDYSYLRSFESFKKWYTDISKDWEPSTRYFALKESSLKRSYERHLKIYGNHLGTINFVFYEYNDNPATFMTAYDSTMLRIKLQDGTVVDYYEPANKHSSTKGYWSVSCTQSNDSAKVYSAIVSGEPIKCAIIHRNSKYRFNVEGYNLN
jgi:hypothetical protein